MTDSTARRPEPAASGTLGKTPFLHLLLYALDKRLAGTIELTAPDERRAAVFFVSGRPAKVSTSEAAEAPEAFAPVARRLSFVAALPPETVYAYYDGFDGLVGPTEGDGEGVDPLPLLWGLLCASPPRDHVRAGLARVAPSLLRLGAQADLERLDLPAEAKGAAALLRQRPMRLSEWAALGQLGEANAQLLAYLLLVTKRLEVLPADATRPSGVSAKAAPARPAAAHPSAPVPATRPPESRPDSKRASGSRAPPPLAPPAGLTPELAERWKEIVERAARIDKADYFMMLDLARDAPKEEVESSFFALAKRWHPDRLPPELSPVRDACSRVFARMSEARSALVDDEQRARYLKLAAEGSGSPEMQEAVARVVEASSHFQKAEVCFKRNDLAQAESLCRKALELDATQPDYLALLAWLTALKPENQTPEKTAPSIDQLGRAIKLSDRCEKAYFWRGMLYKRIGREDLAMKDFRRVAELNPRNIDAAREVRLHRMRGGRTSAPPPRRSSPIPQRPNDPAKPGGLFGRLFKKP